MARLGVSGDEDIASNRADGLSNTSCARALPPQVSSLASSSSTRATRCAVPRCTCSGARFVSVTLQPASAAGHRSGYWAEARADRPPVSARQFRAVDPSQVQCAALARPTGSHSRFAREYCAPVLARDRHHAERIATTTRPASAVPVATVPRPGKVKTRSTARRTKPASERIGQPAAMSIRWARSAATPGSSAARH